MYCRWYGKKTRALLLWELGWADVVKVTVKFCSLVVCFIPWSVKRFILIVKKMFFNSNFWGDFHLYFCTPQLCSPCAHRLSGRSLGERKSAAINSPGWKNNNKKKGPNLQYFSVASAFSHCLTCKCDNIQADNYVCLFSFWKIHVLGSLWLPLSWPSTRLFCIVCWHLCYERKI